MNRKFLSLKNFALFLVISGLSFYITTVWNTHRREIAVKLESPPQRAYGHPTFQRLYHQTCVNHTKRPVNFLGQPRQVWDRTLLVVTLNKQLYMPIKYVELLYRRYFPYILYCAPQGPNKPENDPDLKGLDLAFVYYRSQNAVFNYECIIIAGKLYPDLDGYLIISDDLLLNIQTLHGYNKDYIWHIPLRNHLIGKLPKNQTCNAVTGECYPLDVFHPFTTHARKIRAAMWEIESMRKTSPVAQRCMRRLVELTGSTNWPLTTFCDSCYVPKNKIQDVSTLLDVFLSHEVFVEIAQATVLNCVIDNSDYVEMNTVYGTDGYWYKFPGTVKIPWERHSVWDHVRPDNVNSVDVMHPYKLSFVYNNNTQHVHHFCRYLEYLDNPLQGFSL